MNKKQYEREVVDPKTNYGSRIPGYKEKIKQQSKERGKKKKEAKESFYKMFL